MLVEKILEGGERLPADWACAGTTGYDALAARSTGCSSTRPARRRSTTLDTELRGGSGVDWAAMTRSTPNGRSRTASCARGARGWPGWCPTIRSRPTTPSPSCSPPSRSTGPTCRRVPPIWPRRCAGRVDAGPTWPARSRDRRPAAARSAPSSPSGSSRPPGMVMAKGVEDCAFYRWTRLTSLTEVGAEPSQFAITADDFHAAQRQRLADWPDYHDHAVHPRHQARRGRPGAHLGDLRAPGRSGPRRSASGTGSAPLADGPLAHLVWQAVVGAWPIDRDRLHAYAEKAAREAGVSTALDRPGRGVRGGDARAGRRLSSTTRADRAGLAALADGHPGRGWSNSLSAKLIQLTAPGVPDVYQGTELWENSLVDPDNRRPVDFEAPATLLDRHRRRLAAGGRRRRGREAAGHRPCPAAAPGRIRSCSPGTPRCAPSGRPPTIWWRSTAAGR